MKKFFILALAAVISAGLGGCASETASETVSTTDSGQSEESMDTVLLEYVKTMEEADGAVTVYREESTYTDGGRSVEEKDYENDELVYRILKEKDGEGRTTKYTSYDKDQKQVVSWSAEYDSEGNMIKQIFYDESGAEDSFDQWIYDERGLLVEEISRGVRFYTYEYDENGYRTKAVNYDEDGSEDLTNSYIFENDENGNVIRRIGFDENGDPEKYPMEYEYDPNGKETAAIIYNEDGTLWERRERAYDSSGNILEMSTVSPDGTKTVEMAYVYDDKGRPQEMTAYDKGEVSVRYVYEHDDRGQVTKEYTYDGDGMQMSEETRTYDEAGNLIKCVYEDIKSGTTTTEEYKYGPIE